MRRDSAAGQARSPPPEDGRRPDEAAPRHDCPGRSAGGSASRHRERGIGRAARSASSRSPSDRAEGSSQSAGVVRKGSRRRRKPYSQPAGISQPPEKTAAKRRRNLIQASSAPGSSGSWAASRSVSRDSAKDRVGATEAQLALLFQQPVGAEIPPAGAVEDIVEAHALKRRRTAGTRSRGYRRRSSSPRLRAGQRRSASPIPPAARKRPSGR